MSTVTFLPPADLLDIDQLRARIREAELGLLDAILDVDLAPTTVDELRMLYARYGRMLIRLPDPPQGGDLRRMFDRCALDKAELEMECRRLREELKATVRASTNPAHEQEALRLASLHDMVCSILGEAVGANGGGVVGFAKRAAEIIAEQAAQIADLKGKLDLTVVAYMSGIGDGPSRAGPESFVPPEEELTLDQRAEALGQQMLRDAAARSVAPALDGSAEALPPEPVAPPEPPEPSAPEEVEHADEVPPFADQNVVEREKLTAQLNDLRKRYGDGPLRAAGIIRVTGKINLLKLQAAIAKYADKFPVTT